MASFLSDSEKDSLGLPFFDLHDTFARPITIWKTAQQIVIVSNPSYNFLFPSRQSEEIQEVPVSGVFMARIKYGDKQTKSQFESLDSNKISDQINVELEDGMVRIKLDETGAAFIEGAQRVTLDGQIFMVETSPRPHGLFDPKFKTFYLKKSN